MREKQLNVLITFATTASAMAMEQFCKENGYAGRLIPVPGEVRAGCGLAWVAPRTEKERLEAAMEAAGLTFAETAEYFG